MSLHTLARPAAHLTLVRPQQDELAARLDQLAGHGVRFLRDRVVPGSHSRIEHLAVAPGGVWVIDTARYPGRRPQLRTTGGLLSPLVETIAVGARDRTALLSGMVRRLTDVRRSLLPVAPGVTVRGALCFLDADWPQFGGSFTARGVRVTRPTELAGLLLPGAELDRDDVQHVHRALGLRLPRG